MTIWDEWADENGELGPVYGHQWRSWPARLGVSRIDQISQVIANLKQKPDLRRHIVTAWNPAEVDKMALPPCHALFQFYAAEESCLVSSWRVSPVYDSQAFHLTSRLMLF